MLVDLQIRAAGGAEIEEMSGERFSLSLPPSPAGAYVLAQLDDYMHLQRAQFLHQVPAAVEMAARVSAPDLPGTWGFGFWNDPFNAGFAAGGMRRILPVLPNAAWFFYGSPPNHLSLRDDLPGDGFQAKIFKSPRIPSVVTLLGLPALPFLLWQTSARILRRLARTLIREEAVVLSHDVTQWHTYRIELSQDGVVFKVDGQTVCSSPIAPRGKLGLVIWMDNQYFKFTPGGKIGFGCLPAPGRQALQIQNLTLGDDLR